jgi:peroxiredoxin
LVAAKQKWLSSRVELVGIAIDSVDKIREFSAKYKINYPVLVGDAGTIGLLRSLGNRAGGLPYTLALDVNGAILQRHLGALTEADLRQVMASLSG